MGGPAPVRTKVLLSKEQLPELRGLTRHKLNLCFRLRVQARLAGGSVTLSRSGTPDAGESVSSSDPMILLLEKSIESPHPGF